MDRSWYRLVYCDGLHFGRSRWHPWRTAFCCYIAQPERFSRMRPAILAPVNQFLLICQLPECVGPNAQTLLLARLSSPLKISQPRKLRA
jgi:hypothetical protein